MRRLNFTGLAGVIGSFFLGILAGSPLSACAASVPERPDPPAVMIRLAPDPDMHVRFNGWDLKHVDRAQVGVAAIEAPFAGLESGPEDASESLFRTRRLVLVPGTDAGTVAAVLRNTPGIEAAWVERRYRVSWADAETFLNPARTRPATPPSTPSGISPAPGASAEAFLPDDPQFVDGSQWGLRNTGTGPSGGVAGVDVRAPEGWDVTTGSTTTVVAIIDTGVDLGHPEIAGLLADGSPRIVRAYNSSVEAPGASAWDSVGHGTIVAGVAVGRTNNGPVFGGQGIAGMAGGAGGDSAGCRVLAIKATPGHLLDALSSELAEGIVYAVSRGARVINLSFGGDDDDDTMFDAISFAARRGCVVVCGAGNGQDARPQYPGYYARYGVGLSIAALKSDGTLARFSSRGPQVDVAAPGEDILSTYLTYGNAFDSPLRNYAASSGTSFAAPFVAGIAGLAMGLQPSMTDNEFQEILRKTARDVGAPGRDDTYGWGIPDAGALLRDVSPPRGFLRGSVRAESWRLAATDSVTLGKTRIVVNGCGIDGRYAAERWEVTARVTLPPGRMLEAPFAFGRTHFTNAWSAGPLLEYGKGWAEVVPGSATVDGFTLRGYVYRIDDNPVLCSSDVGPVGWVPARPESVHFGWSAFGRLDAAPSLAIVEPAEDGATWSVDMPETLRWEAGDPDEVSGFLVEVSVDGGATWRRVGDAMLGGNVREAAFRSPCGPAGADYLVRVRALDLNGFADETVELRHVHPGRDCAAGESPAGPPVSWALGLVAPNPARGSAVFRYTRAGDAIPLEAKAPRRGLDAAADDAAVGSPAATMAVYDAKGRHVRTLPVPGESAGAVVWDGRDEAGRRVSPGLYLVRLRTPDEDSLTRRFVLLPP